MADKVIKVWIVDGCIVCNACVTECPQVFEPGDTSISIKDEALKPEFVAANSEAVLTAAKACPTEVIKFEMGELATPSTPALAPKAEEKPKTPEKTVAKPAPAAKPEAKAAPKPPAKPAKKIVRYVPKIKRQDPGELGVPMGQALNDAKEIGEKAPAKRAKAAVSAVGVSGKTPADQVGTLLNVCGGYSRGIDLDEQIRKGVSRNLFKAVFFPKHP